MWASSVCRPAFASAPILVNLAMPPVIRALIWRYRHHVITLFHRVITRFRNVITSFIFPAFPPHYRHLPFGTVTKPCQNAPDHFPTAFPRGLPA
jgi:hypothetical protein